MPVCARRIASAQNAVVEPKAPLPRRLPYVPGLSSPWPSVASEAGANAADGSEFLDDLARKDRPSLGQPLVSRSIDDEVGPQFCPIAQNHAPFADRGDRDAARTATWPLMMSSEAPMSM